MSWEEAGAGESQAKKKWREARLCSWLKTETTQSAARLPVWHSGVMALLSLIYQTKAFSALQHRAFCRPQWYLQKNRWSKPPALEDSAIQSWQPTSCCGICPWGCPAFCIFLWAVTTFDFDYSYFFFCGIFFWICTYLSFWIFVPCSSDRVLQCDLQSWSRGKGNMWGALQVLKLLRHLCQPPQSDPRVLSLPWSAGRRKPDGFDVHIQVIVLTCLDTFNRLKLTCQANSWFSQDLIAEVSSVLEGLLAKQQVYKQKKHQSAFNFLIKSNYQSWISTLAFMPGHASSVTALLVWKNILST